MYKYFIFDIKKEFIELYHKNPFVLFNTLENLYKLTVKDIGYGLPIYEQLCNPFDTNRLHNYMIKYQNINNKYLVNDAVIEINKSCLVVMTKENLPAIFKVLPYYSKNLFVCNFNDQKCFWL